MSLDTAETEIPKRLAAIAKLPKAQLTKDKIDMLKQVNEILKEGKEFQKSRDALNKRIKEAKTLEADVKKWKADFSKFIQTAVKTSQASNKINPDTPTRDFFMIANYLSGVGSTMLDDYP